MTGKPAARQTDRVKGGVIVTGSVTVLIGSQGGIACSVCPGGMAVGSPVNPQLGVNHSMQHALQHGLPQSALAMLGDQGQNTLQRLNSLREQLEKQEQAERTPITVRYYHCDHLGTPLALTDERNQIVWAARLDPWGNVEQEFNPESIDQPIRLQGQHHDKDTDLYYNRHRYYDPHIGSYVNQDPIGLAGGINAYVYTENPGQVIDPLGLQNWAAFPMFDGSLPGNQAALTKAMNEANGIPSSPPGLLTRWRNRPRVDGQPLGWGCGDSRTDNFVPDGPMGYDFLPACRNHDICYGDKSGPSKGQCDNSFLADMMRECENYINEPPASVGGVGQGYSECSAVALIYYTAVKKKGGPAFEAARK